MHVLQKRSYKGKFSKIEDMEENIFSGSNTEYSEKYWQNIRKTKTEEVNTFSSQQSARRRNNKIKKKTQNKFHISATLNSFLKNTFQVHTPKNGYLRVKFARSNDQIFCRRGSKNETFQSGKLRVVISENELVRSTE